MNRRSIVIVMVIVILSIAWIAPVDAQKFPIPDFSVKIPGLTNFQAPTMTTCGANQACYVIPWIGDYLTAVVRFAVVAGAFVAFVMMVWGAFLYLTSGGFASQTEEAKSTMGRAVFGLVLLFTAYILLRTIDPSLVSFKPIMIPAFKNLGEINQAVVPEGNLNSPEGVDSRPGTPGGGPNAQSSPPLQSQYKLTGASCEENWNFANSGDAGRQQCHITSKELTDILNCMYQLLGHDTLVINSLVQNHGNPELCQQFCNSVTMACTTGRCLGRSGNTCCNPNGHPELDCPHRCGSDHYAVGGPRAVDVADPGNNQAGCLLILKAANQCGGHTCFEGNYGSVHVYVGPNGCKEYARDHC